MGIFHLPDLGEGLPDAEIHEWYVKAGDTVALDQPLVSMETAKAVVDVPAPEAGVIAELFGKTGDIIKTGAPLLRFEEKASDDAGTVVGKLETRSDVPLDLNRFEHSDTVSVRATPAVRRLAKEKHIDLRVVTGSGEGGMITEKDLSGLPRPLKRPRNDGEKLPEGFEPLKGVRRTMCRNMTASHQEIVPVTLYDEVDIAAWKKDTDLTVRLIRAIQAAAKAEPALNAWFDGAQVARKCFEVVNIGLAMDSPEGLFVPVLADVAKKSDKELRETIEHYKKSLVKRDLPPECFQDATITLSNFGKFAGRFANPIIVPPTVAILGVGRTYTGAVSVDDTIKAHPLLPLSLSFDHRGVTGGEATRFLRNLMEALRS